jgi:transcriptional regulator with XRE-family HTH domain
MHAGPQVGARIRRARKEQRLTQSELAEKVGVSRSAVDAWENNRSYPKRYDVALEQVLGITLDGPAAVAELEPQDEWEAAVLSDGDLPADMARSIVEASRAARAAYPAAPPAAPAAPSSPATAGRHRAG